MKESGRPFLQPLAVALVLVVLISLFFIIGLMDLITLEKTLLENMENRGLAVITDVQRTAKRHFLQLVQLGQPGLDTELGSPFTDEILPLKESLFIALLDLAEEIDYDWENGQINQRQLTSLTAREGLRLVSILDERGVISLKTGPLSEELLDLAAPVLLGEREIIINNFDRTGKHNELISIVLRRRSNKGTIILALDDQGFRYRCLKVSIQRAIDEMGQVPEIVFFMVTHQNGGLLGHAGELSATEKRTAPGGLLFRGKSDTVCRKIVSAGNNQLEIIAPIHVSSGFGGMARLTFHRGRTDQILEENRRRMFTSMAFMAGIALLSMWFLYKNQNRHLARIGEMEKKLHQAERLSALGRLAAGVAHEIRNPLNAISLAVQRLEKDNLFELTGIVREEIRRLNDITEEFLGLSRSRRLEFRVHDVMGLLQQIVLLVEEEAESRKIKLQIHTSSLPLVIPMDLDKLKQAFFNIIKNAMESISNEGCISLSAITKDKNRISVKVSDTGTGLSSREIEQIFEPDYTTKEKGLGLGLPIAYEIIKGHGGEIRIQSDPGRGTTFEIILPTNEARAT